MPAVLFANTARFPSDTLDGETVLIDATRGHLFLFSGIASHLWQAFIVGRAPDALVAEVVRRYGDEAMASTEAFITELERAEMLTDVQPASVADATTVDWPSVFAAPAIERFEDIADIIQMDPIHDVDHAQGWPKRRTS
jgi:hypothetical protein